jgi:hypothetical protein
MSLAEKIYEEVKKLPEAKQAEIINYIEYVKSKEKKEHLKVTEDFIKDNMEALKELAK